MLDSESAILWQAIEASRRNNITRLQGLLNTTAAALSQEAENAPSIADLTQSTETAVDELIEEMRFNRDHYLALYAQLDSEQQAEIREKLARNLTQLSQLLNLLALVL